MTPLGREWVRKGENDRRTIRQLKAGRPKVHDAICFHCQQCAEKYLKALLHERKKRIPYIHNCEELVDLLAVDDKSLLELQIPAAGLAQYAVEFRYPGRNAIPKCRRRLATLASGFALKSAVDSGCGCSRRCAEPLAPNFHLTLPPHFV